MEHTEAETAWLRSLIEYHIYKGNDLPPIRSAAGYDYVLAGNGLFKRGRNALLSAVIRTAAFKAPLLPPLEEHLTLTHGRIPGGLMTRALSESRERAGEKSPREIVFFIRYDVQAQSYMLGQPEMESATSGSVEYRHATGNTNDILLDLHSHHGMPAWFSGVDDRDEQGLRIYGVLGRVTAQPELGLRVGIYGHHGPLRPEQVFDGVTALVRDDEHPEEPDQDDGASDTGLVLSGRTAVSLWEQLRRCWSVFGTDHEK